MLICPRIEIAMQQQKQHQKLKTKQILIANIPVKLCIKIIESANGSVICSFVQRQRNQLQTCFCSYFVEFFITNWLTP